jgi:hypothetical protein
LNISGFRRCRWIIRYGRTGRRRRCGSRRTGRAGEVSDNLHSPLIARERNLLGESALRAVAVEAAGFPDDAAGTYGLAACLGVASGPLRVGAHVAWLVGSRPRCCRDAQMLGGDTDSAGQPYDSCYDSLVPVHACRLLSKRCGDLRSLHPRRRVCVGCTFLGVKWSQVQILSARPNKTRSDQHRSGFFIASLRRYRRHRHRRHRHYRQPRQSRQSGHRRGRGAAGVLLGANGINGLM